MSLTLVILAAGMGSRYGGLKQLDTFGAGGHTLMEYSIFDAKQAGFDRVVCIVRKDFFEDFKEKIGSRIEKVLPVEYAFQELEDLPQGFACPKGRTKPRGTGHAMRSAKHLLQEGPFVVINADDFYGRESYQVVADFYRDAKNQHSCCLVGYVLGQVLSEFGGVSRGMCKVDENGHLQSIRETKEIAWQEGKLLGKRDNGETVELSPDALCSMNMMGFTPQIWSDVEQYFVQFLQQYGQEEKSEFYMPMILTKQILEKSALVPVLKTHAKWFGVTYQQDKASTAAEIDALIEQGVYPKQLWA